jgi:hypothetical protein
MCACWLPFFNRRSKKLLWSASTLLYSPIATTWSWRSNLTTYKKTGHLVNQLIRPTRLSCTPCDIKQLHSTFRSSSVVGFWFGTLFISSTDETTCEMNFASEKVRKTEYFETQVTFVPSKWLLRTGVVLSVKRLISGIAKPQIQVALRPITILARDNPVFGAIRRGNLRKVQELVASGSVRPTDICVTGRTLFHITLKVLSRIFSKLPTTGEPFSSKKERSLQTLEVCYWLLANGCSPSPPTPFRE